MLDRVAPRVAAALRTAIADYPHFVCVVIAAGRDLVGCLPLPPE